jgi:hypothetical protein
MVVGSLLQPPRRRRGACIYRFGAEVGGRNRAGRVTLVQRMD